MRYELKVYSCNQWLVEELQRKWPTYFAKETIKNLTGIKLSKHSVNKMFYVNENQNSLLIMKQKTGPIKVCTEDKREIFQDSG